MKPTLSFQCNENWDRMKIGVVSRYCESCRRDVMDFTKMTREEILQYLWTNRNEKVCGRFHKSQLDFHHEEILITVEAFLKKNKNNNLAFYLLAASALLLMGCNDDKKSYLDTMTFPSSPATLQMTSVDTVQVTPPEPLMDPKVDGLIAPNICFEQHDSWLTGFVAAAPLEDWNSVHGVSRIVPVMPEFKGGYDSLITFMNDQLQYPEWEKQHRVEGVVVAAFIIDAEGNVTQPKIVKSIPDARNIDNEVLRVVNLMPPWTPGRDLGKNVPVEYTLPVRFKL